MYTDDSSHIFFLSLLPELQQMIYQYLLPHDIKNLREAATIFANSPVFISFIIKQLQVKHVVSGNYHTIFLLENGQAFGCGYNYNGQLGLGDQTDRRLPSLIRGIQGTIQSIGVGDYQTIFQLTNNQIHACGSINKHEQISDDEVYQISPCLSPRLTRKLCDITNHSPKNISHLLLDDSEEDLTEIYTPSFMPGITEEIKSIAENSDHTIILSKNGQVFAIGDNSFGQLGLGDQIRRNHPTIITTLPADVKVKSVTVGIHHTIFLLEDKRVFACGWNRFGGLGFADYTHIQLTPKEVSYPYHETIKILSKRLVVASSLNTLLPELQSIIFSILNATDLVSLAVTCKSLHNSPELISVLIEKLEGKVVKSVTAEHRTFFLMQDGSVFWCGHNFKNFQPGVNHQLTLEPITIPGGGKVQKTAVGFAHTIVLMQDGSVYGWGMNDEGQLGLGHTIDQSSPVQITGSDIVQDVTCGLDYTLFLMQDGSVFVCGNNNNGQLGLGNTTSQLSPVQITSLGSQVKIIHAGWDHTIFQLSDNSLYGCGNSNKGQLGLGRINQQLTPVQITIPGGSIVQDVACGDEYTIILMQDGRVYNCGAQGGGYNLVQITTLENQVKAVRASYTHPIFMMKNNTLFGKFDDKISPIIIPDGVLQDVTCGIGYTVFLMQDGSVYGWGKNYSGQLGLGHTVNQLTPVRLNIGDPKIFASIKLLKQRQQLMSMADSTPSISAPPMPEEAS